MHLAVQFHALEHVALVRFQRTAVIVQVHAGDARDQAVGEATGQVALDRVVLAVLAPAGHDVEAFVDLCQQFGDVFRIVLQVAIHRHDDVAAGMVHARHHRRGLPVVAPEMHDGNAPVAASQIIQQGRRTIGAAVVDQHQFPGPAELGHGRAHLLVQRGDVLLFVVDGHRNGQQRRIEGSWRVHGDSIGGKGARAIMPARCARPRCVGNAANFSPSQKTEGVLPHFGANLAQSGVITIYPAMAR
jgi:hypothetical protein